MRYILFVNVFLKIRDKVVTHIPSVSEASKTIPLQVENDPPPPPALPIGHSVYSWSIGDTA